MVKAKELWETICEEYGYRFFSGVACSEFKPLYNTMSGDFMHYIPAVDEAAALGIALGFCISSGPAAVIMDTKFVPDIIRPLQLAGELKLPIIIIGTADTNLIRFKKKINTVSDVRKFTSDVLDRSKPGLMILGKGDLK